MPPYDDLYDRIRLWIARKIPQWKEFGIQDAAKVLCFFVGPGMGKHNWVEPLTKFRNRVTDIKAGGASVSINTFDYNAKVVPVTSYQAQLLPLSKAHFGIERAALHAVMRAPFNAFRHADFFQLHKIKGPKLRSVNVACTAALFRTAAKTLVNWPEWTRQMRTAAQEHLRLDDIRNNRLYPRFWDSPSFACNLKRAFEGFQEDQKYAIAGNAVVTSFVEQNSGAPIHPGCRMFNKGKPVQKMVYNNMMKHVFPDTNELELKVLVVKRLTNMFHPFEIEFEQDVDLGLCFAGLSELRPGDSAKVLKTWLNGWVTSHRMQEEVRHSCLLGCHGKPDSLHHYVQCPHMYALTKFFIDDTSAEPLYRLGLINPHKQCLKVVCCMFSAYHALKAQIRSKQIAAPTNDHTTFHSAGAQLRRCWSVFAETFAAEAGEFAIQHRSFSLPQIIAFLASGGESMVIPAITSAPIHDSFLIQEHAASDQDTH